MRVLQPTYEITLERRNISESSLPNHTHTTAISVRSINLTLKSIHFSPNFIFKFLRISTKKKHLFQ